MGSDAGSVAADQSSSRRAKGAREKAEFIGVSAQQPANWWGWGYIGPGAMDSLLRTSLTSRTDCPPHSPFILIGNAIRQPSSFDCSAMPWFGRKDSIADSLGASRPRTPPGPALPPPLTPELDGM